MKTIGNYITVFMVIFMMAACGGGSDDPQSPLNPGGDNGGGYPAKVYTQNITISSQGGEQSMTLIDLKSAISNIGSTPDWLIITAKQYSSGSPSIKLEAEENQATSERKAEVIILATSGDKVVLTVVQQAADDGNPEPGTGIDDPHNEQTDQPAYAPRN